VKVKNSAKHFSQIPGAFIFIGVHVFLAQIKMKLLIGRVRMTSLLFRSGAFYFTEIAGGRGSESNFIEPTSGTGVCTSISQDEAFYRHSSGNQELVA
jgi:hypothetical protein